MSGDRWEGHCMEVAWNGVGLGWNDDELKRIDIWYSRCLYCFMIMWWGLLLGCCCCCCCCCWCWCWCCCCCCCCHCCCWWCWCLCCWVLHFWHCTRPNGEVAVLHKQRDMKMVLGPPGAPVSQIYRDGVYMVKLAETTKTSEHLWQTWVVTGKLVTRCCGTGHAVESNVS